MIISVQEPRTPIVGTNPNYLSDNHLSKEIFCMGRTAYTPEKQEQKRTKHYDILNIKLPFNMLYILFLKKCTIQ